MKVYLPDKSEAPTALIPQFRRIIDLYGHGVLGDNAEVWIDPNDAQASMLWTLTDRSALMYFFEAPTPGYIRITDARVRWAPTYDGSARADTPINLDLRGLQDGAGSALRLDAAANFTIVVNNPDRNTPVGVLEDNQKQPLVDGVYHSQQRGITVIDLSCYKPNLTYSWEDPATQQWVTDVSRPQDPQVQFVRMHPAASAFEASHAMVQGTELLTRRMGPASRNLVRSNISDHAVELPPETLTSADERARGVFKALAGSALELLSEQLHGIEPAFTSSTSANEVQE